jgi:hypothetical protein
VQPKHVLVAETRSGEIRHLPLSVGQKITISTGNIVDGISNAALMPFTSFV